MTWLPVTILAYFFLAIAVFGDKYLLTGGVSSPKVYSFYVGILGIFVLVLIPFGFYLPALNQIPLAFSTGAIFITGLFVYYSVVKNFEASRIAPAIGGLTPIFVFLFTYLFSQGRVFLSSKEIFAFILLVLGSVLIVLEKRKNIFGRPLFLSAVASFYFALYFVLAKLVYTPFGFINGLIWIKIGSFLAALFFLFSKEVRSQIFFKSKLTNFKTPGFFIGNQAAGTAGAYLQNWAVALVKTSEVALINALQGIMYVFLFIFSLILSKKFPQILKEEISKEILVQKIIAIILIGGGLALLIL